MSDEKSDARPEGQPGLAASDAQAPDPAAQAGAELTALVAENSDMRDRLLRTMADMENLRRRTEREKADTARYAISNFARDVLTVGDNLRRTIEHVPTEAASQDPALRSFLDGVELTERELLNVLERHGVTRIDPVGQRFDPNCHQAMYEVQNPDVPEGTVVDVMQAGYVIGDRCLRPALVAVAKGGARQTPPDKSGDEPRKAANDDFPGGDPQARREPPSGEPHRAAPHRESRRGEPPRGGHHPRGPYKA
jgi:molecular chaperone GrpE